MPMTDSPNFNGPEAAQTDADNGPLRIEHADRLPSAPEVPNAPFYAAFIPSPSEVEPGSDFPSLDERALRESLRALPTAPEVDLPAAWNLPADGFRLNLLGPEDQAEVRAHLAEYPPHRQAEAETELVRAKIIAKGERFRRVRALSNGSPYHQEVLDLMTETEQLQRQIEGYHRDMAETVGYKPGPNGEPVPVYALSDDLMVARARLVDDLTRRLRLISPDGPEAIRRLADAEERTVAMVKKVHAAAKDEHYVRVKAEEQARDDRLKERIAARARIMRNKL